MMPLALFGCDVIEEPDPTEAPTGAPTEAPTAKPTTKPTEKPTEEEKEEIDIDSIDLADTTYYLDDEADLEFFKLHGRMQVVEDKGLSCDFVASGIEFYGIFEGDITLDILCEKVNDNEAYFTVYINGERQEDTYNGTKRSEGYCHVTEGKNTVTIAKNLKKDLYTIRVLKQTESNYALTCFQTMSCTGLLLDPPKDKDLYIEYIGDSLTCGMGSAGDTSIKGGGSAQGKNGADWEDGTLGYAFTSAEELDADCSIISESGIGISGSWFGATMPEFYLKASYRRSSSEGYDFERVPDLIVINLYTNDRYLDADHASYKGQLLEKICPDTKAFIESIREAYGEDVPIVWVGGVWKDTQLNNFFGEVKNAISQLGGEAANIYVLEVNEYAENKQGAEGHPSAEGHQKTKNELVDFLYEKELVK